jgi:hypothetical protein
MSAAFRSEAPPSAGQVGGSTAEATYAGLIEVEQAFALDHADQGSS